MSLDKLNELTPKEIELCKLFIKYKGKKYLICNELNIKESTCRSHLNNIFSKLYVSSSAELMYYLLTTKGWETCKYYI